MTQMTPVEQIKEGLGFERVVHLQGSTYRENGTIVVIPTRGMVHTKVINAWDNLIAPMNQKRAKIYASGDEVGIAYNKLIKAILDDPNLSQWKYILTLEDDNLPPPDAHIRLLESIQGIGDHGPFDAVSGIYFTKGPVNMPQAYGCPEEFKNTGKLDFRPRHVTEAIARGQIMPVCGIAMGCALWRLDLFRELEPPWFVTVADIIPDKGIVGFTQDLYFCERAVRAGKRFAVDMRVKVGHLDVETGVVY